MEVIGADFAKVSTQCKRKVKRRHKGVNPFVLSLMAIFHVFVSRMDRDMYLMSATIMVIQFPLNVRGKSKGGTKVACFFSCPYPPMQQASIKAGI